MEIYNDNAFDLLNTAHFDNPIENYNKVTY